MIDCCRIVFTYLTTDPAGSSISTAVWSRSSGARSAQKSATIPAIAANVRTIHYCASKPTPPISWDTELRPGNAGTWDGSVELMATCFLNVPRDIRELRVRADAGFGCHPVLEILETRAAQYAVVARLTQAFKRLLPGLHYESVNQEWEMAEFEYRPHGWPQARRFVVARRFIPDEEPQSTLFILGRYVYRSWVTNMDLTPSGIWHYYDGRAAIEPRICELREDYAFRKIPTASFAANALYLEIVRLAYNLVTAFQRTGLEASWQSLTLQKLRYKLFLMPGELTRPQNRPTLRLANFPMLQGWTENILDRVHKLKPLAS
jgi:hypothetical protein